MPIQQLESDIYVITGNVYGSNSTAFVNGDDVLLVDGMAGREDAEDLRQFIEAELNKKVRFIICTHFFSDHIAALELFPESQIIAHKNYLHTWHSENYRTEEEFAHFVAPSILISDGMVMKWGGYTLDIFYNPGHTMSTINIDVPEADLLMVGDTAVGNIVYLYYSAPELLLTALKCSQRRGRGRVIQGHHGVSSLAAIESALYYLSRLQERVTAARHSGLNDGAILEIDLAGCLEPGIEGSEFENIFHKRNLQTIVERKLFAATG